MFKLYIGIGFLNKFYDDDYELNFLDTQTATLNDQELQQVIKYFYFKVKFEKYFCRYG